MDLEKVKVHAKVLEVSVPFQNNSDQNYIAGVVFQDKSRYWRVKFNKRILPGKHRHPEDAVLELTSQVKQDRERMLYESFVESGI